MAYIDIMDYVNGFIQTLYNDTKVKSYTSVHLGIAF